MILMLLRLLLLLLLLLLIRSLLWCALTSRSAGLSSYKSMLPGCLATSILSSICAQPKDGADADESTCVRFNVKH